MIVEAGEWRMEYECGIRGGLLRWGEDSSRGEGGFLYRGEEVRMLLTGETGGKV